MTFWKNLRKEFKINGGLYLMALPAIVALFIFCYVPMVGLVMAFQQLDIAQGVFSSPFVGLKNFEFLFATTDAWVITRNTVCYNLVFIVLNTSLSIILALVLNEMFWKRYTKVLQTVYMMPHFLSMVVVATIVYAFLNPSSGSDSLEPVTLEWYTNVNAVQPDAEMMTTEAQRYIQEKLNATVNFHLYDWGDYGQTIPTMLNADMNLDIVFAGGGVGYQSYAKKNAFLALDDYIDEYLPQTKAAMPDSAWDGVTVDGHIYGIPAEKDFGGRENLEANQTLIDDLGVPFPEGEWNTAYDLIDWLYDCKEARDAKYPELANSPIIKQPSFGSFYYVDYLGSIAVTNIPGVPGVEGMGEGETVFNIYATDAYRQKMKAIRQLVVDGIAPFEDNYDPDDVHRQNGELLGWFGSGLLSIDENANDPYYKTALYVSNVTTLTTGGYTVGPQTISAKCENPERALMVLELVNNDQYLATTLRFGVEGEHWTDEDNDNIIEDGPRNADTANRGWWTWYGWQWGGLFVSKVPVGNPSNFSELTVDFNKSGTASSNVGFVLDTTNITNEVAACANVISEFDGTLSKGQNDNVDELVDEFVAKLEANGSQKIIDEVQSQLDAWRAENVE